MKKAVFILFFLALFLAACTNITPMGNKKYLIETYGETLPQAQLSAERAAQKLCPGYKNEGNSWESSTGIAGDVAYTDYFYRLFIVCP